MAYIFLLFILFFSCSTTNSKDTTLNIQSGGDTPNYTHVSATKFDLPQVGREMRAIWVASVVNIDLPYYPKETKDVVELIKQDIDAVLDKVSELNFNTVFVQVRPTADVFYQSDIEPWSYWLFHEQGLAPPDDFDPLQYWLDEAHKRGIRFHAWLNPFRITTPQMSLADLDENNVALKHPDWVKSIGTSSKQYLWLDPGIPEARQYVNEVIEELVSGYNIDGVVLDDYFYPYQDYYAKGQSFPDKESYQNYLSSSKKPLNVKDWRRSNINTFIREINDSIHEIKSDLLFGVSPFGIWRPGYPNKIRGKDAYNEIYTDSRQWLEQGWLDYFVPQLYWDIGQEAQSFTSLFTWWQDQNSQERHLWAGIKTVFSETNAASFDAKELAKLHENARQIQATRLLSDNTPGVALFSFNHLTGLEGDYLKERIYGNAALVPQSPWRSTLDLKVPQLQMTQQKGDNYLSWQNVQGSFNYVVYLKKNKSLIKNDGNWKVVILPASQVSIKLDDYYDEIVVSSVDRLGNEYQTALSKNTSIIQK